MQVWTLFILGIFSFFLATTLICFLWLQKTVSVGTPLFWVLCFLANTEFKGDNETSPWMFTQLVWNELVLGPPTPTLVPRWLYCENCSFMCCFISLVLLRLTVAFFVCFLYSCNYRKIAPVILRLNVPLTCGLSLCLIFLQLSLFLRAPEEKWGKWIEIH